MPGTAVASVSVSHCSCEHTIFPALQDLTIHRSYADKNQMISGRILFFFHLFLLVGG